MHADIQTLSEALVGVAGQLALLPEFFEISLRLQLELALSLLDQIDFFLILRLGLPIFLLTAVVIAVALSDGLSSVLRLIVRGILNKQDHNDKDSQEERRNTIFLES
jgi:hypothetical protein